MTGYPLFVRPHILRTLRGYYDLGETYTIASPYQTKNSSVELTEIHESTHHWVCSATSFGHFQTLLAILSRDEGVPTDLRSELWSVVTATTEASWSAHEGVATGAELVQAIISGDVEQFESSLPAEYRRAVEPLWVALHLTELPIFVGTSFVCGIGLAIFNTQILDELSDPSIIANTDFERYFDADDRSPDRRFAMIGATLRDPVFASRVKEELWLCARRTFAEPVDVWKMVEAYRSLTLVERLKVDDMFAANTYSLIAENLGDKLTFADPESVPTVAGDFVKRWAVWFDENGVKPRRPIVCADYSGDANRRYEMALRMNYVSVLQETVCINLKYGSFVKELLKLDPLYVWWWFNGLSERAADDVIRERGQLYAPTGLAATLLLLGLTLARYGRWDSTKYGEWIATVANDPYVDLVPPVLTNGFRTRFHSWWTASWKDIAEFVISKYVAQLFAVQQQNRPRSFHRNLQLRYASRIVQFTDVRPPHGKRLVERHVICLPRIVAKQRNHREIFERYRRTERNLPHRIDNRLRRSR
jgi:hypothetical protein